MSPDAHVPHTLHGSCCIQLAGGRVGSSATDRRSLRAMAPWAPSPRADGSEHCIRHSSCPTKLETHPAPGQPGQLRTKHAARGTLSHACAWVEPTLLLHMGVAPWQACTSYHVLLYCLRWMLLMYAVDWYLTASSICLHLQHPFPHPAPLCIHHPVSTPPSSPPPPVHPPAACGRSIEDELSERQQAPDIPQRWRCPW